MKHFLTKPSDGIFNDGRDNAHFDLILNVDYTLVNSKSQTYVVKDLLGFGTFGQVAKCWSPERNTFVAIKILKNKTTVDTDQLREVSILSMLNDRYDSDDRHHIVRMYDHFMFHLHLCICFELLGVTLHEHTNFQGLPMDIVKLFSQQILKGLALLKEAEIIHCDLKPYNILLGPERTELKIIDFGSAIREHIDAKNHYIQTRPYRSPEALLWCDYTSAIDMWSFGCIVAEMFLGFPLFGGASEFQVLRRMTETLGKQPPDHLLKTGAQTMKFFKLDWVGGVRGGTGFNFEALSEEEYRKKNSYQPVIGRTRYDGKSLEEIVENRPFKQNMSADEKEVELEARLALIDLLKGLLEYDPAMRWSPFQASKHPFFTGERFTYPFIPPPDITRKRKRVTGSAITYPSQRGEAGPSGEVLRMADSLRNTRPSHLMPFPGFPYGPPLHQFPPMQTFYPQYPFGPPLHPFPPMQTFYPQYPYRPPYDPSFHPFYPNFYPCYPGFRNFYSSSLQFRQPSPFLGNINPNYSNAVQSSRSQINITTPSTTLSRRPFSPTRVSQGRDRISPGDAPPNAGSSSENETHR